VIKKVVNALLIDFAAKLLVKLIRRDADLFELVLNTFDELTMSHALSLY
jgi:hypothetical protein